MHHLPAIRRTAAIAALAFAPLALPNLDLRAQEPEPAPQKAERPAEPPSITHRFRGGTLAEFLDELRNAYPHINVVASSLASEVPLPAIEFRDAGLKSVLTSISHIVPLDYVVNVNLAAEPEAASMYSLAVLDSNPKPGQKQAQRQMAVFSLKGQSNTTQKLALEAIDGGLAIAEGPKAAIHFHPASGLLFVNGTYSQLTVVQEVLNLLAPAAPKANEARPNKTDADKSDADKTPN